MTDRRVGAHTMICRDAKQLALVTISILLWLRWNSLVSLFNLSWYLQSDVRWGVSISKVEDVSKNAGKGEMKSGICMALIYEVISKAGISFLLFAKWDPRQIWVPQSFCCCCCSFCCCLLLLFAVNFAAVAVVAAARQCVKSLMGPHQWTLV